MRRRRRVLLCGLLSMGLTVPACGATTEGTNGSPEAALTSDVAAAPVEAPDAVPTGRLALAAAAGEPHVLWFWGAH